MTCCFYDVCQWFASLEFVDHELKCLRHLFRSHIAASYWNLGNDTTAHFMWTASGYCRPGDWKLGRQKCGHEIWAISLRYTNYPCTVYRTTAKLMISCSVLWLIVWKLFTLQTDLRCSVSGWKRFNNFSFRVRFNIITETIFSYRRMNGRQKYQSYWYIGISKSYGMRFIKMIISLTPSLIAIVTAFTFQVLLLPPSRDLTCICS